MKIKIQLIVLMGLLAVACTEQSRDKLNTQQKDQVVLGKGDSAEIINKRRTALELCSKFRKQAKLYKEQGNIQRSITADSLAQDIAEKNELKREEIEIIKELEKKYALQLNMFQASRLSKRGLKLAQELNDKKAEADFYSSIARGYFFSRDVEIALKYHFKSLQISKEINYGFGISSALVDIGFDYKKLKKDDSAFKYVMQSKQYLDSLKGSIYEAAIYQAVAEAYSQINEHDSAELCITKAYQIAKKLNNGHAISSIALTYATKKLYIGDIKEAKRLAFESLEYAKRENFVAQYPATLKIIRDVLVKEKKFEEALKYQDIYTAIIDSLSQDKTMKIVYEKEFAYTMQKKENENLLLTHKVEDQNRAIKQNRYAFAAVFVLVALILLIAYLLFRQAQIKLDNVLISTDQKLLRAQMNPHFIFNALNAVKYFINVNQNDKADVYLTSFSKLIRNMLESGIEDSLSLTHEVEMLKNYLQIEALRFNGVFKYEIFIDEKLNHLNPHIPQLMIQPFAENAIWHGLLSKNGDKNLTISFQYNSPDKLTCVIDDNGIGRKASGTNRNTGKKQLAIAFAKQRIELLRKTLKIDCKLTITDKYDNEENALGTTIIIVLPILIKHAETK